MSRNQAVNWLFTCDTPEDIEKLLGVLPKTDWIESCRGQEEMTEEGRCHFIFFLKVKTKKRQTSIKKKLRVFSLTGNIAYNPAAAWKLCSKDPQMTNSRSVEFGVCPRPNNRFQRYTGALNERGESMSEKRVKAAERVAAGENITDILEEDPDVVVDKLQSIKKMAAMFRTERVERKRKAEATTGKLFPWQAQLFRMLQRPFNDREIIVVLDRDGNKGKSWFCDWYESVYPDTTLLLENGKKEGLKYIASQKNNPHVIFFDLAWADTDYLHYSVLEHFKDGMFHSMKYRCNQVWWEFNPHVVVFTKKELKWKNCSSDRWVVMELLERNPNSCGFYMHPRRKVTDGIFTLGKPNEMIFDADVNDLSIEKMLHKFPKIIQKDTKGGKTDDDDDDDDNTVFFHWVSDM